MVDPSYSGVVERLVVVEVAAFAWSCPQHITARYTLQELAPQPETARQRLAACEAEAAELRRLVRTAT